jgi:hypothetical protein
MSKEQEENQLATTDPAQMMKISSDVAAVCAEIVKKTAIQIQGRQYVRVEGWQALATAHGCVAGAPAVERTPTGFRAIGELRRLSDGALLAQSEGFVGEDELTWFGGTDPRGNFRPPRPEYAIRAMAQTRAISRVCRSAFAHCIVLIDADLSTTPAEEIPDDSRETTGRWGQAGREMTEEERVNRELQQKKASRR